MWSPQILKPITGLTQQTLNPSTELIENKAIYNSFLCKQGLKQTELVRHLSLIYDAYIQQNLSPIEQIQELSSLPNSRLCQLFVEIDKFIKEQGIAEFEKRQKGSIHAYFRMLAYALGYIEKHTITENFILALHKKSMEFTEHVNMKNAYRDNDEILLISFEFVSESGLEYLIQLIENGTLRNMELYNYDDIEQKNKNIEERKITIKHINALKDNGSYTSATLANKFMSELKQKSSCLCFRFIPPQDVKPAMDKAIADCNQQMAKAITKEEIINCLAKYTQLFLLIHPLRDHNNRVFANGLANRILAQNGFPFAVYFNPFFFYAQPPKNVAEVMKLSCANYAAMQVVYIGAHVILDFENGVKLSSEEETILKVATKPLLDSIAQLKPEITNEEEEEEEVQPKQSGYSF